MSVPKTTIFIICYLAIGFFDISCVAIVYHHDIKSIFVAEPGWPYFNSIEMIFLSESCKNIRQVRKSLGDSIHFGGWNHSFCHHKPGIICMMINAVDV